MRHLIPVTFPPESPFRDVWGASARLPVVRPEPEQVAIPGWPVERPYCWLIDVFADEAGDPTMIEKLLWTLARRWGTHPSAIAMQIEQDGGIWIMACSCWNDWAPVRCADGRCRLDPTGGFKKL